MESRRNDAEERTFTVWRAIVVGTVAVAVAGVGIWVGVRPGRDTAVLGTKVTRCEIVDGGATVPQGTHRLTAENAPLTVTVSDGRIASVLAPAVKIEPGSTAAPRAASFTIGTPKMSGDALSAEIMIHNLTDCPAEVRGAQAVPQRDAWSVLAPIRFGTNDHAVVSPGRSVAGSFSVTLDGDGTYEITATAYTVFGQVR